MKRSQWSAALVLSFVGLVGGVDRAIPQQVRGDSIALNGQVLSIPWQQGQAEAGRTFSISDTSAWRHLGLQLQGSDRPEEQPIQWFNESLVLDAFPTRTHRYLDIQALLDRTDASPSITGNTLEITLPPVTIRHLHWRKTATGSQLLLALDRPTLWHIQKGAKEATVTLEATTVPELLPPLPPEIALETEGDRFQIQLQLPPGKDLHVESSAGNRLVLNIEPKLLQERQIQWSEAIRWQQRTMTVGESQLAVTWLEIDATSPQIDLKPIWSSPTQMQGTAPLVEIARRHRVAAAINGGFFNRDRRLPLGAIRHEGVWYSGAILGRGAIAWNSGGNFLFSRLGQVDTVQTESGLRLPVSLLNTGYHQAGIARYTSAWGSTYTPLTDGEQLVVVQADAVDRLLVGGVAEQNTIAIPDAGYLLAIRDRPDLARYFPRQSFLQLETATVPPQWINYPSIIGAGPLLMQNGEIVLDAEAEKFSPAFQKQAAIRSAIALTSDNKLILAAIHPAGERGATLLETAKIMQQLGGIHALNLDGGSSTSLYLGGELINRSPETAARVHNAIGVF